MKTVEIFCQVHDFWREFQPQWRQCLLSSGCQRLKLRKRALIESVIDFLKNTCQIQHTRHRSRGNWLANLLSGLAAYSFLPKKPALKLNIEPQFKNLLCLI